MMPLKERNQIIVDAVVRRAEALCPGSLALIGVYGSVLTGDEDERSDLDLLVLIGDEGGRQLSCAFLQDDAQVGHDIYCTTWEDLERDARYEHPHISKLMDAEILWCGDRASRERLEGLRRATAERLAASFSGEDLERAEGQLRQAEHYYTRAMVSKGRSDVLGGAGGAIYYLENAIAMLNKRYFRYGVGRRYEELSAMARRPEDLCRQIDAVIGAESVEALQKHLTVLMGEVTDLFRRAEEALAGPGAGGETLVGSYEEMYSNFRNKLYRAAGKGDRHLLFMSLVSAGAMFDELAGAGRYDVWAGYDPRDPCETARAYDRLLEEYRKEYRRAGIPVRRYADIGAFARAYRGEKEPGSPQPPLQISKKKV